MLDYGLLGEEAATHSRKSSKVAASIVGAMAACVMLGLLVGGGPVASEMAPGTSASELVSVGGLPFTNAKTSKPRLGGLRASVFSKSDLASSPMAKLAIGAIEANNHMNQRDVSMKAVQRNLVSGWDLVDGKTKDKLLQTIDTVKFKASALAGVTAPMNYFDPLGFSTTVTAGKLLFYREVELKHGRVAMLAALGFVVGENFHPLFGGEIDSPAIYAFQETPLQTFWQAVVIALALPEIYSVFTFEEPGTTGQALVKNEQWAIKADHVPGDLGFDPLGLKPEDEDELVAMQTKELNNGRLAMIAIAGMVAQELVTGEKLFS
jgi:hypothetical protein